MRESAQRAKTRNAHESKANKLVLISGGRRGDEAETISETSPVVKQSRLADIQELESRIGFDTVQLKIKRRLLRHELTTGSRVEPGPLRAYFDQTFVITKKGKKFQRSRLIVR